MELDRRSETICPICGKVKQRTQFHPNPVMNGRKYLTVCKTCITEKLREYIKLLGNEGAALWCLCMELGIPFVRSAWKNAYGEYVEKKKTSIATNLFLMYMSHFLELEEKPTGLWDTDMMLSDFFSESHEYVEKKKTSIATNLFLMYMSHFLELEEKPTGLWDTDMMLSDFFSESHVSEKDIRVQRVIDWGHYDETDYEFLEAKMEEYTGQFKVMKPSQVNRYRDLCKAELRKRKLEEDPNAQLKDITAAGKEIMDLMKLLRIDNFQSDTRSDVEKQLEYQAAMIEQTKPCEDEDIMKYQDFCGCQKLEQQLMRPLRNLIAGTRDYPHITKE